MSLEPFTKSGKANNLYATFEHLLRRRDGGLGKPNNVVLAHASCNRERDKREARSSAKHEAVAP